MIASIHSYAARHGAKRVAGTGRMNRRLALALSVVAALSINVGHAAADDSSADLQALISVYAVEYGLPEELLQRVIRRESDYNPVAHSRGHWGLMQIKYPTAKSMGYEGPPEGLLDAETNLTSAAKYL